MKKQQFKRNTKSHFSPSTSRKNPKTYFAQSNAALGNGCQRKKGH